MLFRSCVLRHLPSFPTRRSSDSEHFQFAELDEGVAGAGGAELVGGFVLELGGDGGDPPVLVDDGVLGGALGAGAGAERSEEHTSGLQSLTNLVCRPLLEKKKVQH